MSAKASAARSDPACAPAIVMAAPNGARKSKADHPNLPISIAETVAEAVRCAAAGAAALHAHVRDAEGAHSLDSGLYRELLAELAAAAPALPVQMTTEAVGRYGPEAQAETVRAVRPEMVSVALREMAPDASSEAHAEAFYRWCGEAGVHVQHILYDAEDFRRLRALQRRGLALTTPPCLLFVLGRYANRQIADPKELESYFAIDAAPAEPWFCCAFGPPEAEAMARTLSAGGHARVGFENNLTLKDGAIAPNTAALIAQTVDTAQALGRAIATPAEARGMLGLEAR